CAGLLVPAPADAIAESRVRAPFCNPDSGLPLRQRRVRPRIRVPEPDLADEQTAGRYADLEPGRLPYVDEAGRAVLGVDERGQQRVTPGEVEEVDRLVRLQRMDRPGPGLFVADVRVPPGQPVQLVVRA